MKKYIGTKIVEAEPCRAWKQSGEWGIGAAGYRVKYSDGYESWSPQAVFDAAYRELDTDGQFQLGRFYKHENGRCIAVVGEAPTFAWGKMLVIEETDKTGHGISCISEKSEDTHDKWQEISRDEWLREFAGVRQN